MGFLKSLGKAALGAVGGAIGGGGGGLVGKAIGGLIGKKGGASGGPTSGGGGLGDMVRRQSEENISNPVGFSGKRMFDRSTKKRTMGRSFGGRR